MNVDLSRGTQGRIKFRNGEEWWCPLVRVENGEYFLRYEHGWYTEYSRDGIRLDGGLIINPNGSESTVSPNHERDVIEFVPCEWDGHLPAGVRP